MWGTAFSLENGETQHLKTNPTCVRSQSWGSLCRVLYKEDYNLFFLHSLLQWSCESLWMTEFYVEGEEEVFPRCHQDYHSASQTNTSLVPKTLHSAVWNSVNMLEKLSLRVLASQVWTLLLFSYWPCPDNFHKPRLSHLGKWDESVACFTGLPQESEERVRFDGAGINPSAGEAGAHESLHARPAWST